jgi:ABC-type cobalamin/Fe3+-siderophores transport system ATPase subunit
MIKSLKLRFGKGQGSTAEEIATTPVTVFVGPNNSGKSKVLSEIHQFCLRGTKVATDVIVDQIIFDSFTTDVAEEKIRRVTLKPNASEALTEGHIVVGKRGARHHVAKTQLLDAFKNSNSKAARFCPWYLQFNTLMLDGKSRITLVGEQSAGDLQQPPHTSFQALFSDDTLRNEVRRISHEAFGSYVVVDPTHLGHLRLRLSSRAPMTEVEECGIHRDARAFHAAAKSIDEASDGIKAFTGMITEIIAGDPSILLIDEPEAFLHPSLSNKLGNEIARVSVGSEKRLFVSTHSPNFVMGCIQSGAPVNIVRLTYRDGVATARILPNEDILKLMRNPLLRSTGILNGLFYEFVVVTEADSDRAFYQEINERLQRFMPKKGVPNCLFINAQNKQTVQTIIRPLRDLGIPAAGIVDVDILKEGGGVWTSFLESASVPEIDREMLSIARSKLKACFDATGKNMKQDGGINLLHPGDKEAATNLFERLAEYGLFVVSHGELEAWLSPLNARGHGPEWLIDVFEKMGEDPNSGVYLKPSDGDVWDFVGSIKDWFGNANRKGIPV